MCGRFVRAKAPEIYGELFGISGVPFLPSWNIAPTQQIVVVRMEADARAWALMRWGLIPSWAKDKKTNYLNARSETLFEKPAFRASAKRRRCLVLADGYYEWKALGPKTKQPHYFRLADDAPFAIANRRDAKVDCRFW